MNNNIDADDLHNLLGKVNNMKGTLEQALNGITHISLHVTRQGHVIKELEERIDRLEELKKK